MAAYFSVKISNNWLRSCKFKQCDYIRCRTINTLDQQSLHKQRAFTKNNKHYKSLGNISTIHNAKYSQRPPTNQRRLVPTIFSYFSSAQREARERRHDGITSLAQTPIHNVYSIINSTSSHEKKSPFRLMFYSAQMINFVTVTGATLAGICALNGNLDLTTNIPWSENLIQDYIGLGVIGILTPLLLGQMWFLLWRIPIR